MKCSFPFLLATVVSADVTSPMGDMAYGGETMLTSGRVDVSSCSRVYINTFGSFYAPFACALTMFEYFRKAIY